MPCVPAVAAPWISSNPNMISTVGPCLRDTDTCMCMWGGRIGIVSPGQFVVL
jgi:hypothetical protein